MARNKARIKITLRCDKSCPYCINKDAEYRKKWKEIDRPDEVQWSQYRSIIISGGEPTLYWDRLRTVAYGLRSITTCPIYLQTNGAHLTKNLIRRIDDHIDGIGYSVHSPEEFLHMKTRLKDINLIKPVRLYINKDMHFESHILRNDPDLKYFAIRLWTEGEFDKDEHIFLLKGD